MNLSAALKARIARIASEEHDADCWECTIARVSVRLYPATMCMAALIGALIGFVAGRLV